ncbi:hypothetical protein QYM36_019639, partial [Artemia franciscana]
MAVVEVAAAASMSQKACFLFSRGYAYETGNAKFPDKKIFQNDKLMLSKNLKGLNQLKISVGELDDYTFDLSSSDMFDNNFNVIHQFDNNGEHDELLTSRFYAVEKVRHGTTTLKSSFGTFYLGEKDNGKFFGIYADNKFLYTIMPANNNDENSMVIIKEPLTLNFPNAPLASGKENKILQNIIIHHSIFQTVKKDVLPLVLIIYSGVYDVFRSATFSNSKSTEVIKNLKFKIKNLKVMHNSSEKKPIVETKPIVEEKHNPSPDTHNTKEKCVHIAHVIKDVDDCIDKPQKDTVKDTVPASLLFISEPCDKEELTSKSFCNSAETAVGSIKVPNDIENILVKDIILQGVLELSNILDPKIQVKSNGHEFSFPSKEQNSIFEAVNDSSCVSVVERDKCLKYKSQKLTRDSNLVQICFECSQFEDDDLISKSESDEENIQTANDKTYGRFERVISENRWN